VAIGSVLYAKRAFSDDPQGATVLSPALLADDIVEGLPGGLPLPWGGFIGMGLRLEQAGRHPS